ncbi:DUF4817 domain-containing protein [Trichonephila inaurata madagascariensis]|uniref:DUF4817 domain-containing protein n=1 Tax=Trichonephila inaurata madagascariensis TaxID=2747483 RepID=A0A8X6X195_9ARAC|nr:DUF4817 domain-containing protein [Trichonephila inaurata madagascariensis]
MISYTNQEMANIHFIYGVADGNAQNARQLYGKQFPSRRLPNRKTFERLHRRLRKTGSFVSGMYDTGRSMKTPELAKALLHVFKGQRETSTRTVSATANLSHMMV